MDGRPTLEELAANYGFSGGPAIWPTTVNVRRTPSPGVRGFVGWGPMNNVRWLGEAAADSPAYSAALGELVTDPDFGALLSESLQDDPDDDRAAAEVLLSDLGVVPAIIAAGVGIGTAVAKAAGATAAATGIISAAGALASATAAIVSGIVEQKKAELAAARARGATSAELDKIRRKYGARKKDAIRRGAAARRKLQARMKELRRAGKSRKEARTIATREAKKAAPRPPGRRGGRRESMRGGSKTPEQIARETEQIAAGFSLATDIMRRTAAHVAETSGGYSVDPMTGERVQHRPVTEIVPAAFPPAAPPLPAPSILDRLRGPAFAGVPWWGVLVIGGAGAVLAFGGRK